MLVPAYFNPRSPDGERPSSARACRTSHVISIHAPRVGSDIKESSIHVPNRRFQSTLPGWGATQQRRHPVQQGRISIHAPRVGSDPPPCRSCCPGRYFNPRSPGGERRGASRSGSPGRTDFNPRSPDGERLRPGRTRPGRIPYFNPRSPDGERPVGYRRHPVRRDFNPRSPDGERLFSFNSAR